MDTSAAPPLSTSQSILARIRSIGSSLRRHPAPRPVSQFLSMTVKIEDVRTPGTGAIQTAPFVVVCKLVLPVVDKLGPAFGLVKGDLNSNMQRLVVKAEADPVLYSQLFSIVLDEVATNTHLGPKSCTQGLLWLKRGMEFLLGMLQGLLDDTSTPLPQVVRAAYMSTIYANHKRLTSSAFLFGFRFSVPSRATFLGHCGDSPDLMKELQEFLTAFRPVIADIHQFLVDNNLDNPGKF